MVVGSQGKHYTVTLQDEEDGGPTCRCMDFRIRKRRCKHITLVLQSICCRKASEWDAVWSHSQLCDMVTTWCPQALHCHLQQLQGDSDSEQDPLDDHKVDTKKPQLEAAAPPSSVAHKFL